MGGGEINFLGDAYGFPIDRSIADTIPSDLFRLIEDELRRYPNGCFSNNVKAWYNALHRALSYVPDCSYQVDINQGLCARQLPANEQVVIDDIGFLTSLLPRREALRMIRRINRASIRELTQRTGKVI